MKISKEILTIAKIIPRLRLGDKLEKGGIKPTGPHKVKMLSDRIIKGKDPRTNKEIELVEYTMEENGEKKIYKTKLRGDDGLPSYLVQRLAEVKEGEEIILEMKKQGMKNYVSVTPIGQATHVNVGDSYEEEIIT